MTSFVSVNLADLPAPDAVETIAYESLLASYKAKVLALNPALSTALGLEQSALNIILEAQSYGDMILRARVNSAVRAVLIAFSKGSDLDQICATFYGVGRLTISPAVTDVTGNVVTPAVVEDDDTFRARAVLSMEARSVAGPEGAYDYHALSDTRDATTGLSPILDVATYGEEDGAVYADGTSVIAPEVLVVVLSRSGTGQPTDDELAAVRAALSSESIRPIGDRVTVEAAIITPYYINGVIQVRTGADPSPLVAAALAAVKAYCADTQRIGRVVQRLEIGSKMQVSNDIKGLVLTSPAADIDPGSKGATYCTEVVINYEFVQDSWR